MKYYKKLKKEMTDYDIMCGLDNGDIQPPEWLAWSPCTYIGYAMWDTRRSDGTMFLLALE